MNRPRTILAATDLSAPARHAVERAFRLTALAGSDPAQQIIAMEQEVDCDLIVVGKHGSHIAEELLLGSVTKHVLAEAQGDVLVICDPREPPGEP